MEPTDYSINSTVNRESMESTVGSPPHEKLLGSDKSKGLASVRDSQSAASTSRSLAHRTEYLRVPKQDGSARIPGFLVKGFNVFSTVLSYFLRFCDGGYRPYIKQAERDIDKVADFVEEGARLVVKLADEIEAMAHIAELTAQEAEDLALKVEAKTKIVKQTLDAIADVLEGDKKLSTVLTDYATQKKEGLELKV
ncbi:hypothetical protein M758_3G065800 [Ceratodon purpureus]|nr:hypothetical protein M758_3G065800 [Ceratodon purpureus]